MTTSLVITAGEPAGIGPDICIDLLGKPDNVRRIGAADDTRLYIIADPQLLAERAALLQKKIQITLHETFPDSPASYRPGQLNVIPVSMASRCRPGQLDRANSPYVLACLDRAAELCINRQVDAMVTGPVQKSIINDAGIRFTGHTEYLADKVNATPVMMLATDSLRVALATTHLPLHAVSAAISRESLTQTLHTLHRHLQQHCGIDQPEILVCGLNPHAGENGNLGQEEIDVIEPVIQAGRDNGMKLTGPLPADTLFTPRYLQGADAVLAMYHDQGLPVLKYSGFGKAVNITLGLPFVRTSVDHGTALDLAGTGKAGTGSLLEAIKMAIAS